MDWSGENGSNEKRLLHSPRIGMKMWVVATGTALREMFQSKFC